MMIRRFQLKPLLYVFYLISIASVHASPDEEPHPIDEAYTGCVEKDYTTAGMIKCSQTAEKAWDAELNKVYQSLMAELQEPAQDALRAAQRDWLKFRNAEFKTISEIYGQLEGTMWIVVAADARVEVIKKRTLALQSYLDNFSDPALL